MRTDQPSGTSEPAKVASDPVASDPGDEASDRRTDPADRDHARLTRRTFVLTTGAFGTGLVGSARGAEQGVDRTVTVEATDPYRPAVTDGVDSFERETDGIDVRVRSPRSDPVRRLRDGDVDLHVSGRPMLSHGEASPDDVVRYVTASGWAVLTHAEAEWRDCLRQRELRDRWRGAGAVETWSETDWRSVSAVGRTVGSVQDGDRDRVEGRPTGEVTTLVQGRRSYQYAQGFGGVGYYSVDEIEIDVDPDARAAFAGSNTPLARIGYVHVDGARLDAGVEAFLEFYSRYTGSDAVAYFADSNVENVISPGPAREPAPV